MWHGRDVHELERNVSGWSTRARWSSVQWRRDVYHCRSMRRLWHVCWHMDVHVHGMLLFCFPKNLFKKCKFLFLKKQKRSILIAMTVIRVLLTHVKMDRVLQHQAMQEQQYFIYILYFTSNLIDCCIVSSCCWSVWRGRRVWRHYLIMSRQQSIANGRVSRGGGCMWRSWTMRRHHQCLSAWQQSRTWHCVSCCCRRLTTDKK